MYVHIFFSYKHNFGHVLIPKQGLDVPPSLDKFKRAVKVMLINYLNT